MMRGGAPAHMLFSLKPPLPRPAHSAFHDAHAWRGSFAELPCNAERSSMGRLFVIAPGSRAPLTSLGGLRRGRQLAESREFRTQLQFFARRSTGRGRLHALARKQGHYTRSSLPAQVSVVELLRQLDAGLCKPREQILLEYWFWYRHQNPRRFPRSP